MKRNLKIAVSSLLTASMVLSITACEQTGGDYEITTNADYKPLQEYISTIKDDYQNSLSGGINADMKVEKKISVLNWWDIDETQASVELFKQVYGIPEEGDSSYGKFANGVFVTQRVDYGERYNKLATLVTGGDSPDMFQFEIINFPYSAAMSMFQSLDDYIDFSNPIWDASRDIMKQFQWEKKNYIPITALEAESILWYRRSVCEGSGIKDPYELFKEGNWTWDTFLDICKDFSDPDGGKYVIDGYHVPDNFVLTAGVPLIEIKDGKLSQNFYNADIERAVSNLIEVLAKQNYRKPRNNDVGWSTDLSGWARGNTLFFEGLENDIKDSFQPFITRYKWEDNDLWFVPYPKDPNSDKYYQSMKVGNFMLCAGAKNPTGYAAWQLCCMYTANDKNGDMVSREQLKTNYVGYTDEWFDWLESYKKDGIFTPVFEFKGGIGQDIADSMSANAPINAILNAPYLELLDENGATQTFTTVRQAYEAAINDRINNLNNGTL